MSIDHSRCTSIRHVETYRICDDILHICHCCCSLLMFITRLTCLVLLVVALFLLHAVIHTFHREDGSHRLCRHTFTFPTWHTHAHVDQMNAHPCRVAHPMHARVHVQPCSTRHSHVCACDVCCNTDQRRRRTRSNVECSGDHCRRGLDAMHAVSTCMGSCCT